MQNLECRISSRSSQGSLRVNELINFEMVCKSCLVALPDKCPLQRDHYREPDWFALDTLCKAGAETVSGKAEPAKYDRLGSAS